MKPATRAAATVCAAIALACGFAQTANAAPSRPLDPIQQVACGDAASFKVTTRSGIDVCYAGVGTIAAPIPNVGQWYAGWYHAGFTYHTATTRNAQTFAPFQGDYLPIPNTIITLTLS